VRIGGVGVGTGARLASGAAAFAALSAAALAAGPEQIHISYTGKLGQLSVDFVCAAGGAGSVGFTIDGNKTWATARATFFTYPSIGDMQQALVAPAWTPAPGAALSYYCACADGSRSDVFRVTPVPARYPSEVHVVFGDFGLLNDVSMAPLVADATNGVFDSVLHVGDWVSRRARTCAGATRRFSRAPLRTDQGLRGGPAGTRALTRAL